MRGRGWGFVYALGRTQTESVVERLSVQASTLERTNSAVIVIPPRQKASSSVQAYKSPSERSASKNRSGVQASSYKNISSLYAWTLTRSNATLSVWVHWTLVRGRPWRWTDERLYARTLSVWLCLQPDAEHLLNLYAFLVHVQIVRLYASLC